MAYLDTSILGSYYCPETTTAAVNRALMSLQHAWISPLVEVEFASVLSLKARTGALAKASARASYAQFLRHRAEHLYQFVEPEDQDYRAAQKWLIRFDTSLRALDAFHLAIASNRRQSLWTTDELLARAAAMLGVPHKLIHA